MNSLLYALINTLYVPQNIPLMYALYTISQYE
jgi:hypothetical protein